MLQSDTQNFENVLYIDRYMIIFGIQENNKSLEIDPLDTNTAYNPVAFMSRIDYFLLTLSSFSAISVLPVNYIGNELLNNTTLQWCHPLHTVISQKKSFIKVDFPFTY